MVGRFHPSLVPFLVNKSLGLRDGAMILEYLAPVTPGTSTGRFLAKALGLDDALKDDELEFHPSSVDRDALRQALEEWLAVPAVDEALARFEAFAKADFDFYFRANG